MGAGKQPSKTETVSKTELSPEQRSIMTSVMKQYMPGGKMVTTGTGKDATTTYQGGSFKKSTTFDPTNPNHMRLGQERVAGFNQDQVDAFNLTRQNATAHMPTYGAAKQATVAGMAPTGQKTALGTGWAETDDGSAKFMDFNKENISELQNPWNDMVINTGLQKLGKERDMTQLSINDDAYKAGSFGGSRHGVRQGTADAGFMSAAQDYLGNQLQAGFADATNRYDKLFSQGREIIAGNNSIDASNADRLTSGAKQLADLQTQEQALTGQGINALNSIGAQQQEQHQMTLDAAQAELSRRDNEDLYTAQAMMGFAPPGSSSSTSTGRQAQASPWMSVASAGLSMLPAMLSDERAKEDVENADPEDSLALIRKLKPKTYSYTQDAQGGAGAPPGRRTGFMAQDLERATGEKSPMMGDYKAVDMAEMIGRLTHAVQALDTRLSKSTGARRAA